MGCSSMITPPSATFVVGCGDVLTYKTFLLHKSCINSSPIFDRTNCTVSQGRKPALHPLSAQ